MARKNKKNNTIDLESQVYNTEDIVRTLNNLIKLGEDKKANAIFTYEEMETLLNYIFFKPPNIELRMKTGKEETFGGLPPRQKRFFECYVRTLNGAKSAILAGYSPRHAKQTAWRLLQRIK